MHCWVRNIFLICSVIVLCFVSAAQTPSKKTTEMRPNMTGPYGPWLADQVLGDGPGRLSFRNPTFRDQDLDTWRPKARERLRACLLQPDTGGVPRAELQHRFTYGGLEVEHLRWQLPYGPPTEAYFLKPEGAKGP